MTKLLEGLVNMPSEQDQQAVIDSIRGENRRLEGEVRKAVELLNASRDENDQLKRIIGNLRQQLNPLHRAIRAIFGEIDLAQLEDQPAASTTSSAASIPNAKAAVWDSWKSKLGGAKGAIIEALLQHGECSVEQLCVMTHTSRKQTIYDAANALKKLHLIDGNDGRYRLKDI